MRWKEGGSEDHGCRELQETNNSSEGTHEEALTALVDCEVSGRMRRMADDTDTDQQEMDIAMEANPSNADPTHLTGTHDESCHEQ
jgi:hypothetical protein